MISDVGVSGQPGSSSQGTRDLVGCQVPRGLGVTLERGVRPVLQGQGDLQDPLVSVGC